MDYKINQEVAIDALDTIKELEDLLTERIADLHEVKGCMQARHAYIFYRKLLWETKHKLEDNLEPITPTADS